MSVRPAHDTETDSDHIFSSPNAGSPLFSPVRSDITSEDFASFPSESETGDEDDDDEAPPGSPAPSVYSLTESLIQNSFRNEYGRNLNNHSDIYQLPADDAEKDRLSKQHHMFALVMGKYPPPLFEVLAPEVGNVKSVLDLGCGSGAWLYDVAKDFPHAEGVGVDLVPLEAHTTYTNTRTEVDDINLGLEHFFGQFNVVHTRLISAGIKDYAGLIDSISRILRPGGLMIVGECDFRVYNGKVLPYIPATLPTASQATASDASSASLADIAQPDIPALAQYIYYMRAAARARGGHVDAASLLHHWVKEHPAFKDIVYREVYFPLSPFMQGDTEADKKQRQIGILARWDALAFLSSGRPLLLKHGLSPELVDDLGSRAKRELEEAKVPAYLCLQSVYALRK